MVTIQMSNHITTVALSLNTLQNFKKTIMWLRVA